MSQEMIRYLEDHSMTLLSEAIVDVRANSGPSLQSVSDSDLQVALYTVLLKIIDTLRTRIEAPPEVAVQDVKALFLRHTKELMNFIDGQSSYTVGHTQTTVEHCVQMASRLGLSDEEIEDIEYAAWLQNIGLINQSQRLTLLPRTLTNAELKQARNHTVVSAEMIRPIEFLSKLVPVVRYHHHPFGGSNTPGEPRGEELPLGARIIALCDAYQAMLEPRAYRPALTRQQALLEIVKGSATQFDPKLVPLAHELT
jgi:HD-GYP domain-containing protein (c-di-GMP phosphodiesterase class II)